LIPGPIVAPAPTRRLGAPPVARATRVVGVVLVLVAVTGALAWVLLLSPLTLKRWNLYDSTLELNVKTPGTYVVYEEGPGESTRVGPALALVSVRSLSGRKVPTQALIDENGNSTTTYRTPWHEGRALVSFEADHAGIYELFAFPTAEASTGTTTNASGTPGQFIDFASLPRVAVAPEGVPGGLGTVPGLLGLVALPLLLGAVLLAVASRRWPSPLKRARSSAPANPDRRRRRRG
jgi:hypothetical protein